MTLVIVSRIVNQRGWRSTTEDSTNDDVWTLFPEMFAGRATTTPNILDGKSEKTIPPVKFDFDNSLSALQESYRDLVVENKAVVDSLYREREVSSSKLIEYYCTKLIDFMFQTEKFGCTEKFEYAS